MCMWEGGRGSQAGGKVDGQPAKRSGCLEGVKSERWRGGVCAFAVVENAQRESVGRGRRECKTEGCM